MNISRFIKALPRSLRRQKVAAFLRDVSPSSRIQLIEFNDGVQLYADIRDGNALSWLVVGRWEPDFFDIAGPFLCQGGVFFDVGANFGCCTFGLLRDIPGGKVKCHLFEANRDICDCLNRSAGLYRGESVRVNHACVSDREGLSGLVVNERHLGASFVSSHGAMKAENLILDRYIRDNGIRTVQFMKIDVEGHEPFALNGAKESLASGCVEAVYLEISSVHLSRSGSSPEKLLNTLSGLGFRAYWCRPADLERLRAEGHEIRSLAVQGGVISVVPVGEFSGSFNTDILAVRDRRSFA